MTDLPPEIVRATELSKRFVLRKDNSLKERLTAFGRGRRFRQEFWALRDVDFSITAGSTVGLIGHNGSGKSTLLKVIGGIIDPTSGDVARRGRIAALLELGAGFHPDLTGRENVYLNAAMLGLSRAETAARFEEILEFSAIGQFIDTQVKFYSSGMYVRLAFAVAVHTDPDLLLIDEVLAVGDEQFQRKCFDKIRSFQEEGRTIVLVSHSMSQILDLCTRVILLDHGSVDFDGDPREAVRAFRSVLERRRAAEVASSGHPQKAGQILGARLEVVGRGEEAEVRRGDDLRITVDFAHETGIEGWFCGIQIDDANGRKVVGANSVDDGLVLTPLKEPRRIELLLRDTNFGPGRYFVNISLLDSASRHLDDTPQILTFEVVQDGWTSGHMNLDGTYSDLGAPS